MTLWAELPRLLVDSPILVVRGLLIVVRAMDFPLPPNSVAYLLPMLLAVTEDN